MAYLARSLSFFMAVSAGKPLGKNGLTKIVIHVHCSRFTLSKCFNFSTTTDLKYTLSVAFWNKRCNNQGHCKTDNSGGKNALILRSARAKLEISLIFKQFQSLSPETVQKHKTLHQKKQKRSGIAV